MLKYENKIKSVLKNIGMEIPKYSGYKYTIFCVNNIMEQLDTCSDKPLITVAYSECAKAFSNPSKSYTKQCIEHAIRTYKECAISRDYEKLYGRGTNQTNTVFFYNIIALIEEYNKETDSVFENLKRIDKDDDLYFLLSNGYATSYDIEKAAKIMGKEINHPNIEKDLIKFAKEECNMGIVYISTGSKLNEKTLEAIVKYGAYIRISLPGISEEAYDFYSNQRGKEKFTYEDAIKLLEKICNLRKQFNRERELMVGVRTCIRQKNEGHYLELSKLLGQMGVDSFQMVKVLTDNIIDKKDIELSDCTQKDLLLLDREYKNLGLKHIQTPKLLDKLYINRDFLKNKKPTKCFSSIVSPILYGNSLIVCIHWDKIRDKQNAYYGVLSGKEFELEEIMQGKKAQKIRKRYPMECNNCCALNDNLMLEVIRSNLALFNDVDIIDFMLVY